MSSLAASFHSAPPALKPDADQPHLLHVFPSYTYGGVPIRIAGVINHLGDRYRHTIFALDGNTAAASRLDPDLGAVVMDPAIDKRKPIMSLFRIREILRGRAPDLLLTYNWGAIEWALVNRLSRVAPHIHFESGFGPDEIDGQISRRVRTRRIALAGTELLVVPSQTLVALARDIWRIEPTKIRYIPNGVDCDLFAGNGDPDCAPGFIRQDGEIIVGTVAPLRKEKNLLRLLRGFAAVAPRHNTRLLIAGSGDERPHLESSARDLGIESRVIFTGHVENPERVYPLMDIFAITSDTEQMPNTLIQAMAASRPVAAVDVGDVKVNLSPGNRALVVAREDPDGFSAMLDRLIGDAALRNSLAAENRNHVVTHYSLDRMLSAYQDIFDSTMNGPDQ
jgi:glycosyltransferase involved in cell wall biosynthesis